MADTAQYGGRPIDETRPIIHNADGSFSTERTITVEADGRHYVIPTIVGGKPRTPDEAVALWRTGKNQPVGVFANADEAESYAVARSKRIGNVRGDEAGQQGPVADAATQDRAAQREAVRALVNAGIPLEEAASRVRARVAARAQAPAAKAGAPVEPKMGVFEAAGLGIGKGALLGADEEIGGALESITPGRSPGFPPGYTLTNGRLVKPEDQPPRPSYVEARDARVAKSEKAHEDQPVANIAGQAIGTIATAPFAPAASTWKGAVAVGAGYGAITGATDSKSDLTKGEVGGVLADSAIGAGVGAAAGVAGHAVAQGVTAGVRTVKAALQESKLATSLTKYLGEVAERGGNPEMRRQAAGKLMEEAISASGDAQIPLESFKQYAADVIARGSNPAAGGASALEKEFTKASQQLFKTRKNGITMREIQNALSTWSEKMADAGDDAGARRLASGAREALINDLNAATENPMLARAADLLDARSDYFRAMRDKDLQTIVKKSIDASSEGGATISPQKFASLNTGERWDEIVKAFGSDKAGLEAWKSGVEAARALVRAGKGKSWLPEVITKLSPQATKSFNQIANYRNISKMFTQPEMKSDFLRLISPEMGDKPREALAILTRLSGRLAKEEYSAAVAARDEKPTPAFASKGLQ